MEYFLFKLFLMLSISFVSGKENGLSNDYETTEESITVHLKPYEAEVLPCTIQIETNETGFYDFFQIYDKNKPNRFSIAFKYIGIEDNTCSFIIYHKRSSVKEYFDVINAFKGRWTITEKYSCDKSFWNIVTFVYDLEREGCYREYNVFFNPRTDVEVMSMTLAKTKIIRKAPYDNKTLTVFVQSEAQPIAMCKLYIGYNSSARRWVNKIIIYDKYQPFSSSAESGIEYIGFNDNSCSVRVHLDVLNIKNKKNDILNQEWLVTAMHVDHTESNSIYTFHMNSRAWWIDHHYSKVFLRKKILSIDVQRY